MKSLDKKRIRPTTAAGRWVVLGSALLLAAACDEDAPTGPGNLPADAMLSATALSFGENDVNLGAGAPRAITITNAGGTGLDLAGFSVTGPFQISGGGTAVSVPAGGMASVALTFDPAMTGSAQGSLDFTTSDPDMGAVSVSLSGTGAVFAFDQVDREGIPTLNTVFNHPPAFSKTAFNLIGPDGDLAAYQGQFETVLTATANADPTGTATLLLPDELPVSLGEASSSFASLTGRALADDAIDIALSVVVGIGALQSDNVDSNDVPFLTDFPYLAPAN